MVGDIANLVRHEILRRAVAQARRALELPPCHLSSVRRAHPAIAARIDARMLGRSRQSVTKSGPHDRHLSLIRGRARSIVVVAMLEKEAIVGSTRRG